MPRRAVPPTKVMSYVNDDPPGGDMKLPGWNIEDDDTTVTEITELEISTNLVSNFKFTKAATTDDIVNVDADRINFDSFRYVTKESLVKAIIYFIKNVDQVNKDLISVVLPSKSSASCQYDLSDGMELCCDNGDVFYTKSKDQQTAISSAATGITGADDIAAMSSQVSGIPGDIDSGDDKVDKIDKRVDELSESLTEMKSMLHKLLSAQNSVGRITSDSLSSPSTSVICQDTSNENSPNLTASKPSYSHVAKPSCSIVTPTANNAIQIVKSSISLSSSPKENIDTETKNNALDIDMNAKNTEILLLVPNENVSRAADKMASVKKIAENRLKETQVEFVKTNPKSMKIVIGFKSKQLRDKGKDEIDSCGSLDSFSYHTKSGSKMLPKIYLSNVSEDIISEVDTSLNGTERRNSEKTAIISKILAKNPEVEELNSAGHTLEVVYLNKNATSKTISIGLKVSPAIRQTLLQTQQGNMYLGNSRYKIKDRYHVKSCYHCQLVGHISTDCPSKDTDSVCLYCMGKHRSSSCFHKDDTTKHCCARCLASSQADDAENYKSHNAGDPTCPVALREIERLKGNTELMSKNIM